MKSVLLWLWQLPQNLIGLAVSLFADRCLGGGLYEWQWRCGLSLGRYIFVYDTHRVQTVMHEHGHQIQSLYLGPLYLIAIGLPSLCGNIYDRIFHRDWEKLRRESWYYSLPWEHWADRLGGVKR